MKNFGFVIRGTGGAISLSLPAKTEEIKKKKDAGL